MTEVPQYLLERSRERRSALGLPTDAGPAAGDAADGAADPAAGGAADPAAGGAAGEVAVAAAAGSSDVATAIATAKAAAKLEVEAPPAADPPWVTAARTRHRIPIWALPVLFCLPLWGFVYVKLTEPPPEPITAVNEGAATYAVRCASCHIGDGSGTDSSGVGRPLNAGRVLATFPALDDAMLAWIKTGTDGVGVGNVYGDPNRAGGAHVAGETGTSMPAFGEILSEPQIYSVARYVREIIGGEELTDEAATARDEKWTHLGGGAAPAAGGHGDHG